MISVIIPVKNAGKYMGDMLKSVLAQTYTDFEVIVVIDLSSDNTEAVVNEWEKRDGRIRYYKGPGTGVSASRNLGIKEAKGEYMLFLDGDDFIEPEMFDTLLEGFKAKGSDAKTGEEENDTVIMTSCGFVKEQDGVNVSGEYLYPTGTVTIKEFINERLFGTDINCYQGYVWNKLFRTDMILKYDIRFDEDIFYNEDRLFTVRYLKAAGAGKMIYQNNRPLYRYMVREDSVMAREKEKFLTERETTELLAFERMMPLVKGFEKAGEDIKNEYAFKMIQKFYRMTDASDTKRYKNSSMREHAKRFPYRKYKPINYQERVLIAKLKLYALTGISFGRR